MSNSHQESEREWLNDAGQMLLMLKRAIGASTLPQDIPGYQVSAKIDSGAQGTVYQGTKIGSEDVVAIKVLNQRTFPTSRTAMRLQREIELVGRQDHPGIVRILDSGLTESGRPFLVMEMLTGGTLRDAIPLGGKRYAQHGWRAALAAFLQVCDAVDHAHKRGVLHRDLKPGNVLFDDHGQPRVADFGLAKDIHKSRTSVGVEASLTRAGELLGSPAYSAPEQFSLTDEDDVDVRSDVYSLGAILYELVCGQLPISSDGSVLDLLQRVRTERPESLSRVYRDRFAAGELPETAPPNLPHGLDAVVHMALAKKKDERYQSVAAFAADVQAVLDGEPILARRDSRRKATWRWIKNHRAASVGIVVYTGALLAVSVMSWKYAQRANTLRLHAHGVNEVAIEGSMAALSHLAGGGKYRDEIASGMMKELTKTLEEFPNDPMLLEASARNWIHQGTRLREVGNTEAARAAFLAALEQYQAITEDDDANPDYFHGKSIALVKIGDQLKESGKVDEAMEYYNLAYEIDLKLVEDYPSNVSYLDNLAWSHQRLSILALARNDLKGGEYHVHQFAETVGKLFKLDSNRAATRRADIHWMLAYAHFFSANNDKDSALQWLGRAAQAADANYSLQKTSLTDGMLYVAALTSLHSLQINLKLNQQAALVADDIRLAFNELEALEPQNLDIWEMDSHFSFRRLPEVIDSDLGEAELEHCQALLKKMIRYSDDRPDLLLAAIDDCAFMIRNLIDSDYRESAIALTSELLPTVDKLKSLREPWASTYLQLVDYCEMK